MGRDFKVQCRTVSDIAAVVEMLRPQMPRTIKGRIKVTSYIESLLAEGVVGKSVGLELFSAPADAKDEDLAFVTFNPEVLHCDREVWDLALDGEGKANFMLMHEVAHLCLHSGSEKNYTEIVEEGDLFDETESAEWQANEFATQAFLPYSPALIDQNPQKLSLKEGLPEFIPLRAITTCRKLYGKRYGFFHRCTCGESVDFIGDPPRCFVCEGEKASA